jgi:hypothetical protein
MRLSNTRLCRGFDVLKVAPWKAGAASLPPCHRADMPKRIGVAAFFLQVQNAEP